MKELKKILYLLVVAVVALTVSCTKEGPQGLPGEDGMDGINGADGTAGCVQCHKDDQEIPQKVFQFEHSKHFAGNHHVTHFTGADREGCTLCHTNQGFLAAVESGTNSGGLQEYASGMNCYTCHQIHTTYTREDFAMTFDEPVEAILNKTTAFPDLEFDAGDGNASNLCMKCHQSRDQGDDQPDLSSSETVTGISSRFGPHHGPQGPMWSGKGAYLSEGVSASKGKHDCIFCHVSSPARVFNGGDYVTSMAGGHAFNLSYTDDDGVKQLHLEKCAECHSGGVVEGVIANFDEKIETLKLALQEKGILTESGSINRNYVYSQKELAALWNYKMLEEDLSHGVHNPDYAEKMISSSLTFLAD